MSNRGRVLINNSEGNNIPNADFPINLTNGSLVLHYTKNKQELVGAYIVTSFRDGTGKYTGDSTRNYCSLVNLRTGYLQFDERCSRSTTLGRVISHLCPGDFKGAKAIEKGEFIEVYARGKYDIDLNFNPESNEGWKNG